MMKNFSDKLKELRQLRGLKQKEVAKHTLINQSCYSKWEQGRAEPCLDDLVKLADYFQVSLDYLLGREDDFGNVSVNLSPEAAFGKLEIDMLMQFKKLSNVEQDIILKQIKALNDK